MKIRTRLVFWCLGILSLSLLLMFGVLYYELVFEPGVSRHESVKQQIAEIVGYYALPTVLLLVFGSMWFMRRALWPVAKLTESVERIHGENLRERVPRSGNGDELDRLTVVFNEMMSRLEDSFGRVREFTLHASHELKTPLTVMRGEVETLLRTEQCTPGQREVLSGHLDEIQRLSQIVDNLTLLTKADAGLVTLAKNDVRLDELVREAHEDTCVLGESQQLTVELGACDQIALRGDRDRLRQLFLNLADNAVKYNKPGGRVTFTLRKDHEDAVVTVTNTGSGILPAELPRVFDRFFRGDAAHKCRQDGCGLGLSIVHWIVTAHGGSMAINSERDELTKVAVRLPTGRARKMPDVDRAETRAVAIPRSQNPSVARAA